VALELVDLGLESTGVSQASEPALPGYGARREGDGNQPLARASTDFPRVCAIIRPGDSTPAADWRAYSRGQGYTARFSPEPLQNPSGWIWKQTPGVNIEQRISYLWRLDNANWRHNSRPYGCRSMACAGPRPMGEAHRESNACGAGALRESRNERTCLIPRNSLAWLPDRAELGCFCRKKLPRLTALVAALWLGCALWRVQNSAHALGPLPGTCFKACCHRLNGARVFTSRAADRSWECCSDAYCCCCSAKLLEMRNAA